MNARVIKANDPELSSWVDVSQDSDFPIQNLPFGIFRSGSARAGVAIGEHVLDLSMVHHLGLLAHIGLPHETFSKNTLNEFFSLGKPTISAVRNRLSELLSQGNDELRGRGEVLDNIFLPRKSVEMLMPVSVPNYTDFYSSEEHARNVGSMFRDPKNALLPNWKHLPVGYHGRPSSIVVSGTPIHRPKGQIKPAQSEAPVFQPSAKLDFELEMAFITCKETRVGSSVSTRDAEDCIAGFVLFNDWSARDIQQWEYVPLGPFLGKNFASTVSPWVVTMDALEPFRTSGPPQEPRVLPYLAFDGPKNFDVRLEVQIQSRHFEPTVVSRSNFKYLYWNVNQQLAHHTVNGCNICVGDMYASGTISGPSAGSFGSMLELSWNGQKALSMPDGSVRHFLEDGDTVIMRAQAVQNSVRIGFGECTGKILPAIPE
jgi:fumarylacetoacetase